MTAVESSSTLLGGRPGRRAGRAAARTSADTISWAASNQLTSASRIVEVVGDVAEDRRVVALQDAAGELDADQEADDRGRGCAATAPVGGSVPSVVVIAGASRSGAGTSATPSSEVVDAEVLVVGVDRLALRLGHPERREAVDPLADRGEVARVGGGHHHVRRRAPRRGTPRRSSTRAAGRRRRRSGRPGSARRASTHVDRGPRRRRSPCGRGRATPATVSPTMTRMLTPARGGRGDHVERRASRDSVVTATVVRVIAADSGPAASSARVSSGREPVGVGRAAAAAAAARAGRAGASARRVGAGAAGRERALLEPQDRPGEPGGRAVPGRRRRVPAAALDAQLERGGALLGDADDAERAARRRGTPRARSRRPRRGRTTARRRGARARRRPPARAAPQTSSSQPKESQTSWAGVKPCLEQPLDGLADRRPAQPLSSRVPRPQIAPSAISAPNGGCCQGASLVDGYDVEVRHQHDRPRRRSRPAQRKSRPWVPTRVSSRRSCSSGNAGRQPARSGRTPPGRRAPGRGRRRSGCGPGCELLGQDASVTAHAQ